MAKISAFAALIGEQLSDPRGQTLLLGPLSLASHLSREGARVVICDDLTRPRRLARLGRGLSVLRAHPLHLPFLEHRLAHIVAVEKLGRLRDPGQALAAWRRLLVPDGRLIVVERLVPLRAFQVLRRLVGSSGTRLAPQEVTCLMLNAGLVKVGQMWPLFHPARVITTGSFQEL